MNIFFLDRSPKIAAEYHCDKHVIKMIIESAQMLYCAHWVINENDLPENAYKMAHRNHPCSIWVRQSLSNYYWLCSLGVWLCKEYQLRYGLHKRHRTQSHIEWLFANAPRRLPDFGLTPPAQAMPDEYKTNNAIQAYRTFYIESKLKERNIVKYTWRKPPTFLTHYIQTKTL